MFVTSAPRPAGCRASAGIGRSADTAGCWGQQRGSSWAGAGQSRGSGGNCHWQRSPRTGCRHQCPWTSRRASTRCRRTRCRSWRGWCRPPRASWSRKASRQSQAPEAASWPRPRRGWPHDRPPPAAGQTGPRPLKSYFISDILTQPLNQVSCFFSWAQYKNWRELCC